MTFSPEIEDALSKRGTKAGMLQRACLERLHGHRDADELPTSARFIYYELIQDGIVAKKPERTDDRKGQRPDQPVIVALFELRKRGIIPWDWLVDETRTLSVWRYAASVADYLADTVSLARIDVWGGRPPPMIVTESRSLAGVLDDLARRYLVPISATILERIVSPLDWKRLAVTAGQMIGLPVISKPDNRFRPVRYHDAVETEALGQGEIIRIVREHIDGLLPEPLDVVREREAKQRQDVAELLRRLGEGAP